MNELIPIRNESGKQAVSARDLHQFLGSKKDFSNWIKGRIEKYGLIEGVDYVVFAQKGENLSGGRPQVEYALSIEAAKELAMVEGNAQGKKARQYFIECESKLRQVSTLTPAEFLLQQAQLLVEQERRVSVMEKRLDLVEARTTTRPDYFTIMGYAVYSGIKIGLDKAKVIGQRAHNLCKRRNIPVDKIADPRFGRVGSYPRDILDEVFATPF